MYKVAILVNENEMAHSVFADTPKKLRELSYVKAQKGKYYNFHVFDKFSICDLFAEMNCCYLLSFDSLFISTNATNNSEIINALIKNKECIAAFIAAGKGIFIASQKKLSAKEGTEIKNTGFLPENYDYAIVDRPEKSSADGKISIVDTKSVIVRYPTKISEGDIEYHCANNSFMKHKYRSFIVPNNESQYSVVLADTTSKQVPPALVSKINKSRNVLLLSNNEKERIVISTMALDWADHTQLIENILIFITEGMPNFGFMLKSNDKDEGLISSYILRAEVSNISFRQYINKSPQEMISLPHCIYVFSPSYSEHEVAEFIDKSRTATKNISVYHLKQGKIKSKDFELYHYTNETSVDQIKGETINWIMGRFYPSFWGKSVWSYSYALSMMQELNIDYSSLFPFIYEELSTHFCKKGVIEGNYDNVINATSKLLEILSLVEKNSSSFTGEVFEKYPIETIKKLASDWLITKLDDNRMSEFDLMYVLVSLYRSNLVKSSTVRQKIEEKAKGLMTIYKTKGYINYSNISLCQLLRLIQELLASNAIPADAAKADADQISEVLVKRQDEFGEWRNLSETAEVALLLLDIERNSPNASALLSLLGESVNRAIGRLYQTYDNRNYSWAMDINTTVKAIHAIGLFDKVKNFSANDFFSEIIVHFRRIHIMETIESSNHATLSYIDTIYEKDQLINKLTKKSEQRDAFQWLFFGTFIVALSLVVMMVLIFAGLTNEYVEYNGSTVSVLSRLFNEWQTEFIFGFIGILFGGAVSGIYAFVKRKTFRE